MSLAQCFIVTSEAGGVNRRRRRSRERYHRKQGVRMKIAVGEARGLIALKAFYIHSPPKLLLSELIVSLEWLGACLPNSYWRIIIYSVCMYTSRAHIYEKHIYPIGASNTGPINLSLGMSKAGPIGACVSAIGPFYIFW